MAKSWDDYSGKAKKSTGGDWPAVADDLYDAIIKDISEPDGPKPDPFNPDKEKMDFFVTWEFESEGATTTLRQYITIPETFLSDNVLNENSNMYKVMDALGFDMDDDEIEVDPPWWQGMPARIMVENKTTQKGELRPRITAVKPARKPARKSPAKAAAGRKPKPADDEEDF